MASTDVKFNHAGGDVHVAFQSGPIISHWMARLTTAKVQKQDYEGTSDDNLPDVVTLPASVLAANGVLSWWVVVFGPNAASNYAVSISITQDGKALCPALQLNGNLAAGKAESLSGVIHFQ